MTALTRLEFAVLKSFNRVWENLGLTSSSFLSVHLLVSGGKDSMCLLQALSRIYYSHLFNHRRTHVQLSVLHFNHEKRGHESELDELLVVDACLQLGVPVFVERRSSHGEAFFTEDGNFQDEARNWRRERARAACHRSLQGLGGLRRATHAMVVTAHHARDSVESMLLHILRGSGVSGLRPIAELSAPEGLWRPFARTPYEQVTSYARERGVSFREDASNAEDAYSRNFLRLHVLPLLAQLQPQYQEAFLRLGDNAVETWERLLAFENSKETNSLRLHSQITAGEILRFVCSVAAPELRKTLTREVAENILRHYRRHPEVSETTPELERPAVFVPLAHGWKARLQNGSLRIEK